MTAVGVKGLTSRIHGGVNSDDVFYTLHTRARSKYMHVHSASIVMSSRKTQHNSARFITHFRLQIGNWARS